MTTAAIDCDIDHDLLMEIRRGTMAYRYRAHALDAALPADLERERLPAPPATRVRLAA